MAVILLLGSEGFIGRHVKTQLTGHTVYGVDSLDTRVHLTPTVDASVWVGDYAKYPALIGRPDTVIHLAAQVSVADSATDPERYIRQNSEGTATFLRGLPPSVKRLVVASSMSVYGEGGELVRETDPVCPMSVYGLTKYDQERLCLIWGQQHNVPVIALRFFNCYGPGQQLQNPYTGVLANFAQKLLNNEAPIVFEDGMQTRDFVYVEDVARAVSIAALSDAPSGVYNVCTGIPTTILHAAEALAEGLGKMIPAHVTGETRHGDIRHCTGDNELARNVMKWKPQWTFDAGIKEYAAWLLNR